MLADIELAQTLQATPEEEKVEEVPHPLDRDYHLLKCQLELLDPKAPEYKVGPSPESLSLCPSTLLVCRGTACPWPSLPMPAGPEESSGTRGDSRGLSTHLPPLAASFCFSCR